MAQLFIFLGLIGYLAATICLAIVASQTAQNQQQFTPNVSLKNIGIALSSVAIFCHAGSLAWQFSAANELTITYFQAISLLALGVVFVLTITALFRPAAVLGALIYPFAAIAIVMPLLFASTTEGVNQPSPAIASESIVHVLLGMLGFGFFTAAAAQALLLSLQNRRLKHPTPGRLISALPPLETMESLLFGFVLAGFVALSGILLSGLLITGDLFAQHLVHKAALSGIAWLVFGALLLGRWRFGWRGKTAVRYTLVGYAVVAVAYFGSKLVLELILGQHWG